MVVTKQIQYFRTEDKYNRTTSYTLWLEEGEEKGKVTYSERSSPDDIWGPSVTMRSADGEPVKISEKAADWIIEPQGFTVKEVIADG